MNDVRFCDKDHQPINFYWNVSTGYDCPLCSVVDPDDVIDDEKEALKSLVDELRYAHKRLQKKSKELYNVLVDKLEEENYFKEDEKES